MKLRDEAEGVIQALISLSLLAIILTIHFSILRLLLLIDMVPG